MVQPIAAASPDVNSLAPASPQEDQPETRQYEGLCKQMQAEIPQGTSLEATEVKPYSANAADGQTSEQRSAQPMAKVDVTRGSDSRASVLEVNHAQLNAEVAELTRQPANQAQFSEPTLVEFSEPLSRSAEIEQLHNIVHDLKQEIAFLRAQLAAYQQLPRPTPMAKLEQETNFCIFAPVFGLPQKPGARGAAQPQRPKEAPKRRRQDDEFDELQVQITKKANASLKLFPLDNALLVQHGRSFDEQQTLRAGDRIVAINGVTGDTDQMQWEMGAKSTLNLTVRRRRPAARQDRCDEPPKRRSKIKQMLLAHGVPELSRHKWKVGEVAHYIGEGYCEILKLHDDMDPPRLDVQMCLGRIVTCAEASNLTPVPPDKLLEVETLHKRLQLEKKKRQKVLDDLHPVLEDFLSMKHMAKKTRRAKGGRKRAGS